MIQVSLYSFGMLKSMTVFDKVEEDDAVEWRDAA